MKTITLGAILRTATSLFSRLLLVALVCSAFVVTAIATEVADVTYTWTGLGTSNYIGSEGNWLDDQPPDLSELPYDEDILGIYVLFGDVRRTYINYYELYAHQLEFRGNTQGYFLNGDYDTTHIGSGGIIYNPVGNVWSVISDDVQLHASQVWNIQAGTLRIEGQISDTIDYNGEDPVYGNFQIEKTGQGNLELDTGYYYYGSEWGGGLKLTAGTVTARGAARFDSGYRGDEYYYYYWGDISSALGVGPLIFNGGTLHTDQSYYGEYSNTDFLRLTNNIISNGLVSIKTDQELHLDQNGEEVDEFRLDADTLLRTSGAPVFIEKDITDNDGGYKLTVETDNAIVLYGSSGWTGGTQINKGVLIFGGEDNTPGVTGGITIGALGYAGIGVDNNVGGFLGEIDLANSPGTIGFDSDPDSQSGPDTFTDNVDLTGANASTRLGSATQAILGDYETFTGGVITPQGSDYRFGGGGGSLYVASLLSDSGSPRNVVAESPMEAPLTVWLLNPSNNFSGSVSANQSAVVFGPGVVPANVSAFNLSNSGYVGTAESEFTAAGWLSYFPTNTPGIIGFDIFPTATESWEVTNLSMAAFSSAYVGTTSILRDEAGESTGPGVILSGTIAPNSDNIHRFAAYKGGGLEVAGTLTGNSLLIGTPDTIATFGDPRREEYSIVFLSGDNTGGLTGGTTLYSGQLLLGQGAGEPGTDPSSALGTGPLTVAGVNYTFGDDDEPPAPQLATADDSDIIIPNAIVLNAELGVGGNHDFTLAGNISGSGELYVGEDSDGYFQLTLAGDNTFSGGVYLSNQSSLVLDSNTATGTGPLGFGYSYGSYVYFNTNAPVVGGLASKDDGDYASLYTQADDTVLTINQATDARFSGEFRDYSETQNLRIVKTGLGTLRLESGGLYYYNGSPEASLPGTPGVSLQINQGTLVIGNDFYVEDSTPTIWVHGGTLALAGGSHVSNPVVVDNGGRLGGGGVFASSVSIGNGAVLSPGLQANGGATGAMQFYHLELDAGGIYEFNVQDPDPENYIGRDIIKVYNPNSGDQTLVINADSEHPFIIKVVSLGSDGLAGLLEGIDQSHGLYSWTLINFDVLSISGDRDFDPAFFTLDLTGFASDAPLGGDFSLFLESNNLMLGFTPVPEPSTYVLMALGLGFVVWTVRRRRHIT
ncbi:MAG: PEP-CTERM sorting domain-containing protein [Cephaloticoccus sp.]|nr:PEP-CTERM sorting domain-containing protein [Cephaloticoccus sp.]MCF7758994.1 PEP-CTERM sorting domain-containing protein [Cephaloticoccus sp.]